MKNKLLISILCLGIFTTPIFHGKEETHWVRITYYSDTSGKVADPKTKRAIVGTTVAAHPKFPFGTKVSIPGLKGKLDHDEKFVVHDRGPAVTSKKASRGKAFVFDVYVKTNEEVKAYARNTPSYMKVIVHK